jgi:hypothetical protein
MTRNMSWAAMGAVLLLTCATAVWSQTTTSPTAPLPSPANKPHKGTITGVIAGTDLTGLVIATQIGQRINTVKV